MRSLMALVIAVGINGLLFSLMHAMVSPRHSTAHRFTEVTILDFLGPDASAQPEPISKRRQPPPKPEQQRIEPTQQVFQTRPTRFDIDNLSLSAPRLELDLSLDVGGGPYIGELLAEPSQQISGLILASELTTVVRFPPQYPPLAKRRNIEGFVDVEFTVDRQGQVKDPKIVAADPPNVFNQAVLRALRQWRFEPKRVNGQAVRIRAKQRIDFSLSGP